MISSNAFFFTDNYRCGFLPLPGQGACPGSLGEDCEGKRASRPFPLALPNSRGRSGAATG